MVQPDQKRAPLGSWLIALAVVSALYLPLAKLFLPHFETMDDVAMAMWSSGLCMALRPQAHIIFSHQLFGLILKALYSILPAIGWYGWTHAAVLFVSNVVICRALFRAGRWAGLIGFLSYFALTQIDALVLMQFTKTAFYATLTGAVLAGNAEGQGELLWGGGVAFLGSLIRPESFIFALAVCLPALALRWLSVDGLRRVVRNRLAALVLLVAVPGAVMALTAVTDRLGPWRRYYDYRVYRSRVLDFGSRIDYNPQTRPIFDRIRWTDNHLGMLQQASYYDPAVFSADNFRQLLAAFPRQWQPAKSWALTQDLFRSLEKSPYWELVLTGAAILLAGIRRKNALSLLAAPMAAAILLTAILWLLKWPPRRVIVPTLGCAYCVALLEALGGAAGLRRWSLAAAGLAGLVLAARLLPGYAAEDRAFRAESAAALVELSSLKSGPDQLYFVWSNNFPYEETFLPFDHHPELFRRHLQVGSWSLYNPISEEMLGRFQIQRPYQDLVGNPRFLLIANPNRLELYRRFLRETYQREVILVPIQTGKEFSVWRVAQAKAHG